jgi:6-phosphogluconolactonase
MKSLKPSLLIWSIFTCGYMSSPGLSGGATAAEDAMLVYIGTYTGPQSKGIYVSRFDARTGSLSSPELAAETKNPTFLALHPNRRFLYAVAELSSFGGQPGGAVSAFSIDAKTGRLTLLNQQSSCGAGPCHLTLDSKGKCILAANYGSGSIAALPVESDGKLAEASAFIQHEGSSINPQRQTGPHAHFIMADPANRFALTCDLGLDKVLVYRLDPGKASLAPNDPPSVSIKAGSGPRHLAFHPNGRFVYLINEMGSTLTAMGYDSKRGALEELQTVSTLPENFHGASTGAEVQVHPSGRFVYASNRGHDSIAVFAMDAKSGKLTPVEHQATGGRTPRHFAFDPSGQWLLAENQGSDNIVVFGVDSKSGRLMPNGQTIEVSAPVCVQFVRVK